MAAATYSYTPSIEQLGRVIASVYMSATRFAIIYIDDSNVIRYAFYAKAKQKNYNVIHKKIVAEYEGEVYDRFRKKAEAPHITEKEVFIFYSRYLGESLDSVLSILKNETPSSLKNADQLPPISFTADIKELIWFSVDSFFYANSDDILVAVPRLLWNYMSIESKNFTIASTIVAVQEKLITRWQERTVTNPTYVRSSNATSVMLNLLGEKKDKVDIELDRAAKQAENKTSKKYYGTELWWEESQKTLEGFVIGFIYEHESKDSFEVRLSTKSWEYLKRIKYTEEHMKEINRLIRNELKRRQLDISKFKLQRITVTPDCILRCQFGRREKK